ncbi:hypothetical protein [Brevundimonas sanguinis]|uniref:hypothetical protein n=1 Tax=Brevundimonas sanguinis TaxID=3021811 RepID=UPI0024152AB5|nr:hypothetical protein [Brevundimonas sp. NCCP 15609]
MPRSIRMVSVPEPLWMMHVIGPDDIYPAPDHATAVKWCAYLNRVIAPRVPGVLCVAVPAIWTGTAEEHAEGLPEAIKGWTQPLTAAPVREEGRSVEASAILEMAAKAQKQGREWVKGSLWDDLTREASGRIRALKSQLAFREEAQPPTCQKCGGGIAGWLCQRCPAEFRENDDGALVFDEDNHPAPEAEKLRRAMPDLSHVIAWLRNGCEVEHAITELEVYQARIIKSLSASAAVARASEQG